ncbi:MAG: IS4 family transposase [Gammaproteobacteria bacterium]|nr:IS4 family transposase [Gammaproteobacteria bacterium]
MVICGREFSSENIHMINNIIAENDRISRTQLSQKICKTLNWRSTNGKLKDMSCRIALLKMNHRGIIELPQAHNRPKINSDKGNNDKIIQGIAEVECNLSELGKVEIIRIDSRYSKCHHIWKEMMRQYHYLGSGPLCGQQMKYLIKSEDYGYLGGFAFSSAAWRLEVRDKWIGWDDDRRIANLNKVICNSRFLIVPGVKVKNLASYALSKCIEKLQDDWYKQYNIRPVLLETFVDRDRFNGSSYRASNWIHIGSTKGRGRQDRKNEFGVSVKDVYLYPLDRKFREELCNGMAEVIVKKTVPVDWAEEEFSEADIGDQRRVNRLITIARDFYTRPQGNIPQACGGNRAKTKAAYRFLENEKNTMKNIHKSHYKATLERIRKNKVVLAVQDTTTLNYSTHPATERLGLIGSKEDGIIGLIVHDTIAFNTDGTPLGVIDVQCWARDPAEFGKKHKRKQYNIEQKESNKWLKSFNTTAEAQRDCQDTMLVSVGDRESDIYELFHLALNDSKGPKLLVRAEHNRLLADGQGKLYEYISGQELAGIQTIHVPRKKNQPAREAKLEIRFAEIKLKPPQDKKQLGELTVFGVIAEEVEAPEGVERLRWILLTTCEIRGFEEAIEKLKWYCIRWGIEIYHRTLKSGCKIEQRQLGSADRIETCLAIDMVVAWRIYHLTKLGREVPDMPCTVFFDDAEWKALVAYKTQNPIPPEKPPTLREATRMAASLGGFLGRKSDGEPGTQTLWLGLQRLDDITEMWKISISTFAPHLLRSPPVSSN